VNRRPRRHKYESYCRNQSSEGVQCNGDVRLAGIFGPPAMVIAGGNGNRVWVRMNDRGFSMVSVFLMVRPHVYVLVGRHEKRL
jgi:hypothetical protein